MTPDEYTTWAKHHAAIFPDFRNWWDGLTGEARVALREQFRSILSGVMLADACEASNRMLAGTVELCPAYERSMLASRIASAAREIAADRAPKRPQTSYRYRPSRPGEGPTAGEIFRAVLDRAEKGEDPVAVAKELLPPLKPEDQPRFRCIACQDTGLVWVWSNVSLKAALAGTFDVHSRYTMTVACQCEAGAPFVIRDQAIAPKGWHGWRESARYTPDRYCRCVGGSAHSADAIAEFVEWVGDYRQRITRNRPNYEPSFDSFNDR